MKQTGSLNWPLFIHQWFIRISEFIEFNPVIHDKQSDRYKLIFVSNFKVTDKDQLGWLTFARIHIPD